MLSIRFFEGDRSERHGVNGTWDMKAFIATEYME